MGQQQHMARGGITQAVNMLREDVVELLGPGQTTGLAVGPGRGTILQDLYCESSPV